jgi:hypothetical protein
MFLEIVTRHYAKRPKGLKRNQESLARQTCDDWQQTLLIDRTGRGVEWANWNLRQYAPFLEGDYIWILDDDDVCTCDTLVADLKRIVEEHKPDAIMVRGQYHAVLPENDLWRQTPKLTHIGSSCFVLRREVFQRHARTALTPELGMDYRLIRSVFDAGVHSVYWYDVVVMEAPRKGWGKADDE